MTINLLNKTAKVIDLGYEHSCCIASDDKAYCWGSNSFELKIKKK
jgi:alpha-tubulin suppressor-like RCC1 family protein